MLSAEGTARARPERGTGLPYFTNSKKASVAGIVDTMQYRKAKVGEAGSGKYCGLFRPW